MENQSNKVVFMRSVSQKDEHKDSPGSASVQAASKSGWTVAAAAFLALGLVIILFFALQQQMSGLIAELKNLSSMKNHVSDMQQRVNVLEDKIPLLDAVPAMAKRTMVRSMLKDVEQRVAFLAKEAETEEQSAKFRQAAELLAQIEADLKE